MAISKMSTPIVNGKRGSSQKDQVDANERQRTSAQSVMSTMGAKYKSSQIPILAKNRVNPPKTKSPLSEINDEEQKMEKNSKTLVKRRPISGIRRSLSMLALRYSSASFENSSSDSSSSSSLPLLAESKLDPSQMMMIATKSTSNVHEQTPSTSSMSKLEQFRFGRRLTLHLMLRSRQKCQAPRIGDSNTVRSQKCPSRLSLVGVDGHELAKEDEKRRNCAAASGDFETGKLRPLASSLQSLDQVNLIDRCNKYNSRSEPPISNNKIKDDAKSDGSGDPITTSDGLNKKTPPAQDTNPNDEGNNMKSQAYVRSSGGGEKLQVEEANALIHSAQEFSSEVTSSSLANHHISNSSHGTSNSNSFWKLR